jgi:chitodextrinase
MTDPLGNAWYDSSGYENGDECAWNFIVTGNNGWGDFTQTVSGDRYYAQPEWSNRHNNCLNTNTSPQPTASFTVSPNPPVHGSAATFTATASDSDDTAFTYAWTFGDGTTGTGRVVSHTYAAAGSKVVTLVVTDAHGDAKRVSTTYTVS